MFKKTIQLWLLVCASQWASAEQTQYEGSFIPISKPFLLIEDKFRRAEAWATCSAVFDVYADFVFSEDSSQSQLMNNLSNGADIAVAMSYVQKLFDDLDNDVDNLATDDFSKRFNNTWAFAKTQMESLPEIQLTSILANLESSKDMEAWTKRLEATFQQCTNNGHEQQLMIDMWREMVTSGMLRME